MFLQGSLICRNTEILQNYVSCDWKSYAVRGWPCEALWKSILVDRGTPCQPFGSSKSSSRRLGRPLGAPSDLFRALLRRLFDSLGALLSALRRSCGALGALLGRSWGSLGSPGDPQRTTRGPQEVPEGSPGVLKGSPRVPKESPRGFSRGP